MGVSQCAITASYCAVAEHVVSISAGQLLHLAPKICCEDLLLLQIARRSVSNRIRRTIADPLSQVVEVNGVHQSDHGAPSALTT